MRRFILPMVVLAGTIAAGIGVTSAAADSTIVVGNCKSGTTAPDITSAIGAASDGDTILVCPGSYSGFTVNKSVTIRGSNGRIGRKPQRCLKPSTFPGNEPNNDIVITGAVTVSASNVKLQQMTFAGGGTAITASGNNFTLLNGVVQNNSTGLSLTGSNQTVTDSCFRSNSTGINSAGGLTDSTIQGTYFFSNSTSGINLAGTTDSTVGEDNYSSDDNHFLVATGTTNLTITRNMGDPGLTLGDDGDLIQLLGGNSNFHLNFNQFDRGGDANGFFFSGGNQGEVLGNLVEYMHGTGIIAAGGGLTGTTIEQSTSRKNGFDGVHGHGNSNGGSGLRLDAGSTGNTIDRERLNGNGGIDCDDQGAPGANTWGAGNRGDDQSLPGICGKNAVTVP